MRSPPDWRAHEDTTALVIHPLRCDSAESDEGESRLRELTRECLVRLRAVVDVRFYTTPQLAVAPGLQGATSAGPRP